MLKDRLLKGMFAHSPDDRKGDFRGESYERYIRRMQGAWDCYRSQVAADKQAGDSYCNYEPTEMRENYDTWLPKDHAVRFAWQTAPIGTLTEALAFVREQPTKEQRRALLRGDSKPAQAPGHGRPAGAASENTNLWREDLYHVTVHRTKYTIKPCETPT